MKRILEEKAPNFSDPGEGGPFAAKLQTQKQEAGLDGLLARSSRAQGVAVGRQ